MFYIFGIAFLGIFANSNQFIFVEKKRKMLAAIF